MWASFSFSLYKFFLSDSPLAMLIFFYSSFLPPCRGVKTNIAGGAEEKNSILQGASQQK
jgi:hypothetical protein